VLQVNVLDAKMVNNSNYESLCKVVERDTKVMSMHLHEKLSGNQHAESLRRKHLECWDLHVAPRSKSHRTAEPPPPPPPSHLAPPLRCVARSATTPTRQR
jgi:hypothetical protein